MTRLSVCIATRNRGHVIGETLECLLAQVTDEVEIVVVDGASTDATQEVVGAFAARSPAVRYVRLEQNGGVDLDYHRAVDAAGGEFCWLFTDDDELAPGAVSRVLRELQEGVDLVVVNAGMFAPDLEETLVERRMKIGSDRSFAAAEFDDFARVAGDHLSYIGGVVIRRSVWRSRDVVPYLGTEFIHCGVIFQRPPEGRITVLAEPLVQIREGVALWSARSFHIWMFKWPQLIWSFETLSEAARRAIVPREPWRQLRRLMASKAWGEYTGKQYQEHLRDRDWSPLGRASAWAIACAPDRLVRWVMRGLIAVLFPGDRLLRFKIKVALWRRP
ncbi:MAG: glycosyltransferase family 2 protein [Deltaproteobacteria bacterium]|nr:glycosyltransferase family 2 protein [Deltaproteobacteria bacterium]